MFFFACLKDHFFSFVENVVAKTDILGLRLTTFLISKPFRLGRREWSHWLALSHMQIHGSITVAMVLWYFECPCGSHLPTLESGDGMGSDLPHPLRMKE